MKIQILDEILAGNMGDGWKDQRETANAFADFLADHYRAIAKNMYPDAAISVEIEVQNASGCSNSVQVVSDDIAAMVAVETALEGESNFAWETWCASDEARALAE